MNLGNLVDLVRRDGTKRRHPALPPTLPLSPLQQWWRYSSDQAAFFAELAALPGGAFTIDLPEPYGPVVGFSDEASLRAITAGTSADFGQANAIVSLFVGRSSILLLDGDLHSQARARTLSAFAGERMRGYGPTILESADRYVDRLARGATFSAREASRDLALDVILRALFGYASGEEYDRMFATIVRFMDGAHHPVGNLMTMLVPATAMRGFMTGRRDPSTMRLLPDEGLVGIGKHMPSVNASRELLDRLLDRIEWRAANLEEEGTDALGTILRRARDSGLAYDPEQALDEVLTLLLAGHDTTAITLAWLFYRLGTSPEVGRKLRDELNAAYGDGPIDTRTIERLPYLRAVVDETFRLDGIGRAVGRRVMRDTRLGGYDLPAGTFVLGYSFGNNRSKEKWEFPDEFVPDQFVGKRPKPHEFTPFGAGYRRCVGAAFAEFELRILAAEFVRRVDFTYTGVRPLPVGMMGPIIAPACDVPIAVSAVRPRAVVSRSASELGTSD